MRTLNAHWWQHEKLIRHKSSKKATNLTLNSELLAEAKRLNINLSATMERALEKEVKQRLKSEWLEQNAEAINACNIPQGEAIAPIKKFLLSLFTSLVMVIWRLAFAIKSGSHSY